jgi:hypothetical protein
MPIPGGSRATRKLSFVGRISIDKRASVYEYRVNSRVVGRSETIARWRHELVGYSWK